MAEYDDILAARAAQQATIPPARPQVAGVDWGAGPVDVPMGAPVGRMVMEQSPDETLAQAVAPPAVGMLPGPPRVMPIPDLEYVDFGRGPRGLEPDPSEMAFERPISPMAPQPAVVDQRAPFPADPDAPPLLQALPQPLPQAPLQPRTEPPAPVVPEISDEEAEAILAGNAQKGDLLGPL